MLVLVVLAVNWAGSFFELIAGVHRLEEVCAYGIFSKLVTVKTVKILQLLICRARLDLFCVENFRHAQVSKFIKVLHQERKENVDPLNLSVTMDECLKRSQELNGVLRVNVKVIKDTRSVTRFLCQLDALQTTQVAQRCGQI